MRFATICAVLLACFSTIAAAKDDRDAQPVSIALATTPATPTTVATASALPLPEAPLANNFLTPTAPDLFTSSLIAPTLIKATLVKRAPTEHRLFDFKNFLSLSAVAVSLTADALSTQKGLAIPGFYEMNPIARPFVQTRIGAAAYSAASFGLIASTMYVAHKTHHHRLERIMPFAVAGWEGLLSVRNYHVISSRPR
ncbi:MAG: hypothetical protein WA738_21845 [Candidatus Angelobacter sp.]